MTTVTESDIKKLKNLINQGFDQIKIELKTLEKDVTDLKIGQGEIKVRLTDLESNSRKIPDLAEKVGELKNWKQAGFVIITAFISSIFSGAIGGTIGWITRGIRVNP
jgi:hypothetical protein